MCKGSKKRYLKCIILVVCLAGVMLFCPCKAEAKKMPLNRKTVRDINLPQPKVCYMGATSKGVVKLKWDKVSKKNWYAVYRSKEKKGTYKRIAVTMKASYCDRTGKENTTYYYKITSLKWKKTERKWHESRFSPVKKAKVRKEAKKIAYVGDSITTGYSLYHIVGGNTKVFAQIGLSASGFYGSGLYYSLLQYNPDRMIMMFGMNSLPGNPSDAGIDTQIRAICNVVSQCRKKNPNMEIIIMGVSPVGRWASVRLGNVNRFNLRLKNALKKYKSVHYYDPAVVLAGSDGYLRSGYGGGDGIHWSPSAYKSVYNAINQYVIEWEQRGDI